MVHRIALGSLIAAVVACPVVACTANVDVAGNAGSSGSDGGPGSPDQVTSAAAAELSIGQTSFAPGEITPSNGNGQAPGLDLGAIVCHPELFARSVEYSEVLNYHVNMFLKDVGALLQDSGTTIGSTSTWTYNGPDADLQLVLVETSAGVFTVTLGIAAPGGNDYVTVVSGVVNRSNPNDTTKQLTFDLDALHRVLSAASGDQSSGQLAVSVERVKNPDGSDRKRVVSYTLTSFVPVYGDPRGPRSGTISLLDEPSVGGAMLYDASTIFSCPPNPQGLASSAATYVRWVVQGDTVAGRADAVASGGQMTSGDRWVGLSCRTDSSSTLTGSTLVTDNGYWLIKEESSSGATILGLQTAVQDTLTADAPCNPAFGAVTDLDDDANDPTLPTSLPSDAFPNQF